MAKVLITESTLSDIAEAIRGKTGQEKSMKPSEMAVEISGIADSADDMRQLIGRTITEYTDSELTKVGMYSFYFCKSLTYVDLPACTFVDHYAFYSCSSLSEVKIPLCATLGSSSFNTCLALKSVSFPACTRGAFLN